MKRERRKDLTVREWQQITSRRPVVRRILRPQTKLKSRKEQTK
jgi:hypothetical protein